MAFQGIRPVFQPLAASIMRRTRMAQGNLEVGHLFKHACSLFHKLGDQLQIKA